MKRRDFMGWLAVLPFLRKLPVSKTPAKPVVVVSGDSNFAGYGTTGTDTSAWPASAYPGVHCDDPANWHYNAADNAEFVTGFRPIVDDIMLSHDCPHCHEPCDCASATWTCCEDCGMIEDCAHVCQHG